MAITFDGPNTTITLDTVTDENVSEIYSRWKDWVWTGDNSKYLPAFREVGGDPLGGGVYAGINIFLRNDYGWRIKPPEQDIQIKLTGNLYAEDPFTAMYIPTTGGYDTLIQIDLSVNLIQTQIQTVEDMYTEIQTITALISGGAFTKAALANIPVAGFKKNTAYPNFQFQMFDSVTHAPLTSGTIVATRSIDGGAFGSCANSVSWNGEWAKIDFAASDLNGDTIAFYFKETGTPPLADSVGFTVNTIE